MEQNLEKRIDELEQKVDKIYASVEKTRKYFLWTLIATLVVFVLPLLAAVFIIPSFISSYTSALGSF